MAEIIGIGILMLISVTFGALLALGILEGFCLKNKEEKKKDPPKEDFKENKCEFAVNACSQDELLDEWLYGQKP